jgi:DNA-binding transcriptional LysR family regulator
MPSMELRQLQYFAEVARRGTYLAAAAALSVAQPALWRRVKDLELELGTPLFERAGRRVRLTRAGQLLLEDAETVLAASASLERRAEDLRLGRAGHLAIACAAPHLRAFLAPVIAEFRAAHPGVTVEVREYGGGRGRGPGTSARDDLIDGTADVGTGVPPDAPEFDTVPLYDMHLVLAVPDDHPWRDAATIEVAQLRGEPLVLAQAGSFSRGAVEAACARAGFEPLVAIDSPNPLSIQALGAAGLGLPVLVDDALPEPADRPWPRLAERGRIHATTIRLGWRNGSPISPLTAAFIDLARRHATARATRTGDAPR